MVVYNTECPYCKTYFETDSHKDFFCDDNCIDKYIEIHKDLNVKKIIPNRKCWCGSIFPTRKKRKIFCSEKCKQKYYNKIKRKVKNDYLKNWRKKKIISLVVTTK